MKNSLGIAIRVFVVAFLALGIAYPLAITGIAQLLWPSNANGSLVLDEQGTTLGSALIGQPFVSAAYFHPRASASGYDAMASGGTNLGPTSRELASALARRRAAARGAGLWPADLLTASGSGLDPDISPANALTQAPRIAHARGVAVADVRSLVDAAIVGPDLGFIGEPRVNVLALNLRLDDRFGKPPGGE